MDLHASNILLIDDALDHVGGMGRIEDQVEMAGLQPICELPADLLIGRITQVLDAPMLDRHDFAQAVILIQDFDGWVGPQARDGRLRQDFPQPVKERQFHDQIANAVPQTEQNVRRLDVHHLWKCDLL